LSIQSNCNATYNAGAAFFFILISIERRKEEEVARMDQTVRAWSANGILISFYGNN
jgi:hypothetical protein